MKNRLKTAVLAVALTAMANLGGCAAAPAVQQYRLPQLNQPLPPPASAPSARRLRLHGITLARHLDVQGLIYQTSDVLINEAHAHRWAGLLDEQLNRTLRRLLATALPDWRVLRAGELGLGDQADYNLHVHLERFQGRHDGQAIVSGYWLLRDANDRLVDNGEFNLEQALQEDGYPALVRSLDQGWRHVAAALAEAVQDRMLKASHEQ